MRNENGAYLSRTWPIAGAALEVLTTPWVSWNSIYWAWRKTRAWWRQTGWWYVRFQLNFHGIPIVCRTEMWTKIRESHAQKGCAYCNGNVNIRGLKNLGYRFSIKDKSFLRGLPFCFFMDFTIYVMNKNWFRIVVLARNHNIWFLLETFTFWPFKV